MPDPSVAAFVMLALALFAGGLVQSVVGIGSSLVFAPAVAVLTPHALPDVALWTGLLIALLLAHGERSHVDVQALVWSVPARLPGTAVGLVLLAIASTRMLGMIVGAMVLFAVIVSARRQVLATGRWALATAGFTAGITGTATSIDGPPIALVVQGRPPHVRSTLAAFFAIGVVISLGGLAVAGRLDGAALRLSALLAPAAVAGVLVGAALRHRLPEPAFRTGVLVVCAISGLLLLVRSLG